MNDLNQCTRRKGWGKALVKFLWCLLFLFDESLAQFQRPSAVRFKGNDIWKGTPEVRIDNDWYIICADSTYWNLGIADTVCAHRGFFGVMLVRTNPSYLDNRNTYANCEEDYNGSPPLLCKLTDNCPRGPRVSCQFPGHQGCFPHTNANPFFPAAPTQSSQLTIESCATDCYYSGHGYFGVAFGQVCVCSYTFETNLPGDEACEIPCSGDIDQVCGGGVAMSVYDSNLGACGDYFDLFPDVPVQFTSEGFPNKFDANYSCWWTLNISLEVVHDLEITVGYNMPDDQVEIYEDYGALILASIGRGSGRTTRYIEPYPRLNDVIYVNLYADPSSAGGTFIITFHLIPPVLPPDTSSSPPPETTDPPPPLPPTTPLVEGTNNIALYAGIGAGVGVAAIIIIIMVIVVVCMVSRRAVGRKAESPAGLAPPIGQAPPTHDNAYYRGGDLVTTNPQPGKPVNNEDTHRYATIDGGYYYAPNTSVEPPLPAPRDGTGGTADGEQYTYVDGPPGTRESQYEELPADSSGTPYQSLTKTDRQSYQDLVKNDGQQNGRNSYISVDDGQQNDGYYLEPM